MCASACDRGDDAGGESEFADAVIAGIGDVEVAGSVEGEGGGEIELGRYGGACVAGEAWSAAGYGDDVPVVRLSSRMRWLWVSAM